jgi:hypothetical protein
MEIKKCLIISYSELPEEYLESLDGSSFMNGSFISHHPKKGDEIYNLILEEGVVPEDYDKVLIEFYW